MSTHTGCPGSRSMQIQRSETSETIKSTPSVEQLSKLQNWPVQIKLAPVSAPYFNGAKLLIAADCTAYAYASFHQDFIRNKVTLIGCPKLDQVDYYTSIRTCQLCRDLLVYKLILHYHSGVHNLHRTFS